jgi:hypothetical protein
VVHFHKIDMCPVRGKGLATLGLDHNGLIIIRERAVGECRNTNANRGLATPAVGAVEHRKL